MASRMSPVGDQTTLRYADGELILFWSLPVLAIIWVAAFLLFPGFVQPMSPSLTAEQVASFYRDPENLPRIRYSMILFNWFGVALIPLLTLVIVQIHRMAHHTPILAYCFLGCMCAGPTMFFVADLFWLLAAFRPERPPELTQLFNDLAWVSFIGQVGFLIGQNLFLALAIYLDRQPRPVFGRWFAHFNLLIAALLAPAAFVALHLSGPFAWDGLWCFWVRNIAIAAWMLVTAIVLGDNIYRQRREEGRA